MFLRLARWSAGLTLAFAVTGCGGGEGTLSTASPGEPAVRPTRLPERLQSEAFEAQQPITAYCRRASLALQGSSTPPGDAARRRAMAAAGRLADLARTHPLDLVQTGVDVRLYTSDLIEDLGNLNCDPDLIARLEAGLG